MLRVDTWLILAYRTFFFVPYTLYLLIEGETKFFDVMKPLLVLEKLDEGRKSNKVVANASKCQSVTFVLSIQNFIVMGQQQQ